MIVMVVGDENMTQPQTQLLQHGLHGLRIPRIDHQRILAVV